MVAFFDYSGGTYKFSLWSW